MPVTLISFCTSALAAVAQQATRSIADQRDLPDPAMAPQTPSLLITARSATDGDDSTSGCALFRANKGM